MWYCTSLPTADLYLTQIFQCQSLKIRGLKWNSSLWNVQHSHTDINPSSLGDSNFAVLLETTSIISTWSRLPENQYSGRTSYRWTGWVWEITGWSSRLTDHLGGIYYRNTSSEIKQIRKISTCNRLELESLGSIECFHWFLSTRDHILMFSCHKPLSTAVIKTDQLFHICNISENNAIFYFTSYCRLIPHTDLPMPITESWLNFLENQHVLGILVCGNIEWRLMLYTNL